MSVQPWTSFGLPWLFDVLCGADWPQGDEDAVRRCAQAWTDAMVGLLDVGGAGNTAASQVFTSVQSLSAEAFDGYWKKYVGDDQTGDQSYLASLARHAEQLATMLLAHSDEIEYTKIMMNTQLVMSEIQILMAIAQAIFTEGTSLLEIPIVIKIGQFVIAQITWRFLLEVLQMVLPDVVAQAVMLADGHESSPDFGKTMIALATGVVAGKLGELGQGLSGRLPWMSKALTDTFAGRLAQFGTRSAEGALNNGIVAFGGSVVPSLWNYAMASPQQRAQIDLGGGPVDWQNLGTQMLSGGAMAGIHHFPDLYTDHSGPITTLTMPNGDTVHGPVSTDGSFPLFNKHGYRYGTGSVGADGTLTVHPLSGGGAHTVDLQHTPFYETTHDGTTTQYLMHDGTKLAVWQPQEPTYYMLGRGDAPVPTLSVIPGGGLHLPDLAHQEVFARVADRLAEIRDGWGHDALRQSIADIRQRIADTQQAIAQGQAGPHELSGPQTELADTVRQAARVRGYLVVLGADDNVRAYLREHHPDLYDRLGSLNADQRPWPGGERQLLLSMLSGYEAGVPRIPSALDPRTGHLNLPYHPEELPIAHVTRPAEVLTAIEHRGLRDAITRATPDLRARLDEARGQPLNRLGQVIEEAVAAHLLSVEDGVRLLELQRQVPPDADLLVGQLVDLHRTGGISTPDALALLSASGDAAGFHDLVDHLLHRELTQTEIADLRNPGHDLLDEVSKLVDAGRLTVPEAERLLDAAGHPAQLAAETSDRAASAVKSASAEMNALSRPGIGLDEAASLHAGGLVRGLDEYASWGGLDPTGSTGLELVFHVLDDPARILRASVDVALRGLVGPAALDHPEDYLKVLDALAPNFLRYPPGRLPEPPPGSPIDHGTWQELTDRFGLRAKWPELVRTVMVDHARPGQHSFERNNDAETKMFTLLSAAFTEHRPAPGTTIVVTADKPMCDGCRTAAQFLAERFGVDIVVADPVAYLEHYRVPSGAFLHPNTGVDEGVFRAVEQIPEVPGVFNAIFHATAGGPVLAGDHVGDVWDLARLLPRERIPGNVQQIRLIACDLARNPEFLAAAREYYGRDVVASDKPVWIDTNGNVVSGTAQQGRHGPVPRQPYDGHWFTQDEHGLRPAYPHEIPGNAHTGPEPWNRMGGPTGGPGPPTGPHLAGALDLADAVLAEVAPHVAGSHGVVLAELSTNGNLALTDTHGRTREVPVADVRRLVHRLIAGGADVHRARAEALAALGAKAAVEPRRGGPVPVPAETALSALGRLHADPDTPPQTGAAVESLVRDILARRPDLAGQLAGLPGHAGDLVHAALTQLTDPVPRSDPAPELRPGRYRDTVTGLAAGLAGIRAGSADPTARAGVLAESTTRVAMELDRAAGALDIRATVKDREAVQARQAAQDKQASGDAVGAGRHQEAAERAERQAQAYRNAADLARTAAGSYRELNAPLAAIHAGTATDRLLDPAVRLEGSAHAKHDVYEEALRAAGPALDALHAGVPGGRLPHTQELGRRVNDLLAAAGSTERVTAHALEELLRGQFRQVASADGVVLRFGSAEIRLHLRMSDPVEVTGAGEPAHQTMVGQFPQAGRPVGASVNRSRDWSFELPVMDVLGGLVKSLEPVTKLLSLGVGFGGSTGRSAQGSGADFNQPGAVADNRGPATLFDLHAEWRLAVRSGDYHLDLLWRGEVQAGLPGESAWKQATTVGADDSTERLALWVPHPYTEPTLAATVTIDSPTRTSLPEHVLTGMTGLDHLGDALIDQLPAAYRDEHTVGQLRTNLDGLRSQLTQAVNTEDGYWFPLVHDGHAIGLVRVHAATDLTRAHPAGTASDLVHQERLRISFSVANGSTSTSTSWHLDGSFGAKAPHDPLSGTLGLTGSASVSRSASETLNVGATAIHPMVARFSGHTQAYHMEFDLAATVELFEHPAVGPLEPVHVDSQALVRLPEQDAYLLGLPVDSAAVVDGTLRELALEPVPPGYDLRWPDWLGATGSGHSTVRGLTGLDSIRRDLLPRLAAEGLLPRRVDGTLVWSPDPLVRDAQLHNLKEVSEQLSAQSMEGRYDQAAQSGVLLELVKAHANGAPEHVVYRITLEQRPTDAHLRGLTAVEKVVNLNIASDSLGSASGRSVTHTWGGDLNASAGPGHGTTLGSGDFTATVSTARTAGESFGHTVNDVQLLESKGRAAVFTMPHDLVVHRLGSDERYRAAGTAEVLLPADLFDGASRAEPGTWVSAADTPAEVLERVKVVHLDVTGLVEAAAQVLPGATEPGPAALGQLTALTNTRNVSAHAKELFAGHLGTDLAISGGAAVPTRASVELGGRAGRSTYLGWGDWVAGDINFTLGSFGTTLGSAHGTGLGTGLDIGLNSGGPGFTGDVRPNGSWNESAAAAHTDLTIVGREQLAITTGRVYLYRTPVDLTITGDPHLAPALREGRTMVYALGESEALGHYAAGILPVSLEHVSRAIDRWAGGDLQLDRNVVAKVIDRYHAELAAAEPGHPRLDPNSERARELADRLAAQYPDVPLTGSHDPLATIHQLAHGGHPPTAEHWTLPEHLRHALGNTPIESVHLVDRDGRPVQLHSEVTRLIHQVVPDAHRLLPGLREGLRGQLGGSRWYAGGHPHTMEDPEGLTLHVKVPVGRLFVEDVTIRLKLHREPGVWVGSDRSTGLELQDYLYRDESGSRTASVSFGGGAAGDATTPAALDGSPTTTDNAALSAATARGHSGTATSAQQQTRVGYLGDFVSGVDRFNHPVTVTIEVTRSLPRGQWGNPAVRMTDLWLHARNGPLAEATLRGDLTRLVPSAVVRGGHPVDAPLPDPRTVPELPPHTKVLSAQVGGLMDSLTRRLASPDLLGEQGVYTNRGRLEAALSALTRNAALPAMASRSGHLLLRLPDPRDPGRMVEVHVKARVYDLRVTHADIEGESLGMVNRLQRTAGQSSGEGRILPLSRSLSDALSVPSWGDGDKIDPTAGLGSGAQAAENLASTGGSRDETTVKQSGLSSVVRVRLDYDVTLTVTSHPSGQLGTDRTVLLPHAALGRAYLQVFNSDLSAMYHGLEYRTVPESWSTGPLVDRGWLPAPGGTPVIRLAAGRFEAGTGALDPLVHARMLAAESGAEVILDVTGPSGAVEHYRALPDGSLHSVEPDQGFAATLGTLPPDLVTAAHQARIDLAALYRRSAGQHLSFAEAVRVELAGGGVPAPAPTPAPGEGSRIAALLGLPPLPRPGHLLRSGSHLLHPVHDAELIDLAARRAPTPGFHDLVARGNGHTLLTPNPTGVGDRVVSPVRLAARLRAEGLPPDATLRLLGSEVGGGRYPLALARALHQTVVATDASVLVGLDGGVVAGRVFGYDAAGNPLPGPAPDGTWRAFHPDGTVETLMPGDPRIPAGPILARTGAGWLRV